MGLICDLSECIVVVGLVDDFIDSMVRFVSHVTKLLKLSK
jgi:hypothetical protein